MKYFSISELTYSDTAKKYKIDNTPTLTDVQHLNELVDNLLDPIREAWGSGIKITSGYRSKKLNDKLSGSAKNSSHLIGYAADTYPSNGKYNEYVKFVVNFLKEKGIKFDQCIEEKNSKGGKWLHLGYKLANGSQRGQVLKLNVK